MENTYIEKFESKIPWATILSISAISAIYVWFLYYYEIGKASYFRIPNNLVYVKITDFYSYTIENVLFILFMAGMIFITGIFYDLFYIKTAYFKSAFSRATVILGIRSGLLIYVLIVQHSMLEDLSTLLFYLFVLFFVLIIFAMLDYRFMNAPAIISKDDNSVYHTIIKRKNAYTYYVFTLVVQILIYIPIFYFAYGYNNARFTTEFLSVNIDNRKQLIVGMYDDCYIVKSIEDVESRNNSRFKKIDPESINGQQLEWVTITLKK